MIKSMTDTTISVIVPVYGAEAFLDKCVSSIRKQTADNLEIILVDDGSKDRGGAMCDEYALEDPRIKVIHKENGGLMSAWMEGVKNSQGEYLCFVDSDDFVDTNMIGEMSRYLKGGKEIVCCNFVLEHDDGRQEPQYHAADPGEYKEDKLRRGIRDKILGNETRTISMSRCMKLIKRELITENMKYCDKRIRMAEDVNIMLPAILDAERIYVMKDACFYHYYCNDASIVHHYDSKMNDNMDYLYSALKNVLADKLGEGNYEAILEREMLFMFMLLIKNELRNPKGKAAAGVLELINKKDIKRRVKENPLTVSDSGNKLIYFCMKNPGLLSASVLTLAFRLKNRGR